MRKDLPTHLGDSSGIDLTIQTQDTNSVGATKKKFQELYLAKMGA